MGADVTTAVPAVVGVIESRTALLLRGDGATVSPCTNQSRGWRAGCRDTSIARLLTRVAQRLLIKPGKDQRLWRACVGVCWAWERSQERCWEHGAIRHG